MKKIIISISLIILAVSVFAQNVNLNVAQKVAANYYATHKTSTGTIQKAVASLIYCKVDNNDTLYYIFNIGSEGFVIVSADYSVTPILAFSDEGNFVTENQAPALTDWLKGYATGIKLTKSQNISKIKPAWNVYSNDNLSGYKMSSAKNIAPLVTTKWDQSQGYNYHCPLIASGPGGRCYAGCVATAMAQIIKYYNYPVHGTGSHSYYHPYYVSISADFDTTYYDWTSMTNILNNSSKEAISTLIFDCGVSVDMDYAPTGSGANIADVPQALKSYFGYRPTVNVVDRSINTDSAWHAILTNELELAHPVLYSGAGAEGGHAWVCDGVKDTILYHFNWGWSGANNGYFSLDSINSGNGDFTAGQQAVVDFVPSNAPYCLGSMVCDEPSKIIGDGSGYSYYWNNTNCGWLIQPPNANKILLTFMQFQTEAQKDFVNIYDGTDATAPLLGSYSGHNLPSTLIANSGSMFITFTTDGENQDQGWQAYYTSVVTGINESNFANALNIFPVPATTTLNIVVSSELTGMATKNIYNITGQLVKSENIQLNNSTLPLDISSLVPGIYNLVMNSGKYCIHKKFIKE